MEQVTFKVQGSQPEPYTVTFNRDGKKLVCLCNCQAGVNGLYCKHRLNILMGSIEGVVGGTEEDVKTILSWLPGTKIEEALKAIHAAMDQVELAKRFLEKTRIDLAKSLRG